MNTNESSANTEIILTELPASSLHSLLDLVCIGDDFKLLRETLRLYAEAQADE